MKEGVFCGSQQVIDGWTGKVVGWAYGPHILETENPPEKCPVCGLLLGRIKVFVEEK